MKKNFDENSIITTYDKILNFKIIIEQDEDKNFIVSVPTVPGCYSQGKAMKKL